MTATFLKQVEELTGNKRWHNEAWKRFQAVGLPTRKNELFKFVRLRSLYEKSVQLSTFEAPKVPHGVVAIPLSKAWETYGAFLEKRYAQFLEQEKDPFALINAALDHEGLFIYIPPNVKIEHPLKINSPRVIAYIAKHAEVEIELSTTYCDFAIEQGAKVTIQRTIDHLQSVRATLKRDAFFKSVAFSSNELLARDDYHIQLAAEGAHASLFGLHRISGKQQAHTNVLMEHIAPNTTSIQKFKSVIDHFSRSTFEGKIYVHSEAQKTQAYQINNSLILNPRAEAKCKPNLEIFADDVKASHGATIGQLDNESLFYLQARGISQKEAKALLIEAFCREVIDAAIS